MNLNEDKCYLKSEDEDLETYIDRLSTDKDQYGYTWQDIADIVEEETGFLRSSSWYRKRRKKSISERVVEPEINLRVEKKENPLYALQKERVKLSDERRQISAEIRRLAREDTLKEIAHDFAEQMSRSFEFNPMTISQPLVSTKSAILCISDWHYGIEIQNAWNVYNPTIAQQRVQKLYSEVVRRCLAENVTQLYVCNLGDMISGRIHLPLRLNTRLDVISQEMEVCEILARFLADLAKYFKIDYYECLDNHSRLEPRKPDSLELENLSRLSGWYLKERLAQNPNYLIRIMPNSLADDIITFECEGFKVAGVHGHKDSPATIVSNLTSFTHNQYQLVLCAHRHRFGAHEDYSTVVLENGSLMGVDEYAVSLRLCSHPSQTLIIVSPDNLTDSIIRIALD